MLSKLLFKQIYFCLAVGEGEKKYLESYIKD